MTSVMSLGPGRPDTEVTEKASRRRFTAEYKRRILHEAASCSDIGALLRREGLYSSHLTYWRKEAARGELQGLGAKKCGPQPKAANPLERELRDAQREIARWKRRAERAEAVVEVQKKVSQLLGIALPSDEEKS
jgi:transposase